MIDWVKIDEDEPQVQRGRVNVSIDIDVLLKDGTILWGCFYGKSQRLYFDEHGNKIPNNKIKGWRTHEKRLQQAVK